jgi:hypothetical protein
MLGEMVYGADSDAGLRHSRLAVVDQEFLLVEEEFFWNLDRDMFLNLKYMFFRIMI